MNGDEQIRCAVLKMMTAAVTMLALALTACSDDGGGDPGSEPSTMADGGTDDDTASAQEALTAAVRAMDQESLGLRYEMRLDGTAAITIDGVQDRDGDWSATARFDDPSDASEPAAMDARSSAGSVWMTMRSWPAPDNGCWLEIPRGQTPVGISGLLPDELAYARVLSALHALDFEPGSTTGISGEIDLRVALSLVQSQALAEVEIDPARIRGTRVPATIELRDGKVAEVTMTGGSLLDTFGRIRAPLSAQAYQALKIIDYQVSYTSPATDAVLPPPADGLVLTPAESESRAGCR